MGCPEVGGWGLLVQCPTPVARTQRKEALPHSEPLPLTPQPCREAPCKRITDRNRDTDGSSGWWHDLGHGPSCGRLLSTPRGSCPCPLITLKTHSWPLCLQGCRHPAEGLSGQAVCLVGPTPALDLGVESKDKTQGDSVLPDWHLVFVPGRPLGVQGKPAQGYLLAACDRQPGHR